MTRKEAISNLKEIKGFYGDDRNDGYVQEFVALDKDEKEAIDVAIKALEQDRPTEHWKDGKWCSNCGEGIPTEVWGGGVEKDEIKFCFSCGARMENGNMECKNGGRE